MCDECHKKAIYSFVSSGEECIIAMLVFWFTLVWEMVEAAVCLDGDRSSCPSASMSLSGAMDEMLWRYKSTMSCIIALISIKSHTIRIYKLLIRPYFVD